MKPSTLLLGCLAIVAVSCGAIVGETPDGSQPGNETTSSTLASGSCLRSPADNSPIDTGTTAGDVLFLAAELHSCAPDAVIVGTGNLNEVAAAAQLAASLEAPLFFPEPRLSSELGRLRAQRVHVVGATDVNVPGDAEMIRHTIDGAIDTTAAALDGPPELPLPEVPNSTTVIETSHAIALGDKVARPATPADATPQPDPSISTSDIVEGLASGGTGVQAWIVDASDPALLMAAQSAASTAGAHLVPVDGADLLGHAEVANALAGFSVEQIRFIGPQPSDSSWELSVLRGGQQLPGGGFVVLPENDPRRYLAYYGHPETTALGILGEQGPAETLMRMQDFIDAYSGDGRTVIPTFEIIASVASAGPGEDGNYSYEWPIETFTDWIDFARDNDLYVILDLQSGRSDFLTQARFYEPLLKLPFVGLALDPEWRLKSDQVHLEQVGTVDAAEINETVNWVADLVREHGLPQKMIIAHQFRTAMITNREAIVERPEIQMIIQMDGDGTEPQKDNTWRNLQEGAADAHWSWGWKNFFDEDEPGPPTPDSTMSKQPSPVYVSYQ